MLPYRYSYSTNEIIEGLALFVSARDLRDSPRFRAYFPSAATGVDPRLETFLANGDRYFVVVARCGDSVVLVPTYHAEKHRRRAVVDKEGHPGWVDRLTFFDPGQVWVVDVAAVVGAAERAGDWSEPSHRNRVRPAEGKAMRAAIRAALGDRAMRGGASTANTHPSEPGITGSTKEETDETPRAA